jgi:hypothetical protein
VKTGAAVAIAILLVVGVALWRVFSVGTEMPVGKLVDTRVQRAASPAVERIPASFRTAAEATQPSAEKQPRRWDTEQRRALLGAILASLAREQPVDARQNRASESQLRGASPESTSLDEKNVHAQVREAMRELLPLFHECQEMGQGGALAVGKLVFEMSIIGDETVGGLVENVVVAEDDQFKGNPSFSECMRETLFSMKLPAPRGRGRLTIRYPMMFSEGPNATPEPQNLGKADYKFEQ